MSVIKSLGYNLVIGNEALKSLSVFLQKKKYSSIYILCDDNTLKFCLPALIISCQKLKKAEIIEIENGEASKSIEIVAQILQTLVENQADRNSLVINLGGGVVSDLGGFCASIYKRGIDFINVPTSLLAMADASVGGKTGIDFGGLKNSVGTFAQPRAVFINPGFLETLSVRHFKNGLAEIFKIALVSDKKLWAELTDKKKSIGSSQLITKSLLLKNKIVLKDPYDQNLRKTLNFGHSIGHALESLLLGSKAEMLHGEAIVVGMIIESSMAFQNKLITKEELAEISSVLLFVFDPQKLIWMNGEYIRKTENLQLKNEILNFDPTLREYDQTILEKLIEPAKTRMKTLADFKILVDPFVSNNKTGNSTTKSAVRNSLQDIEWNKESILSVLKKIIEEEGIKFPDMYEALIGARQGLSLPDAYEALGREKTLELLSS